MPCCLAAGQSGTISAVTYGRLSPMTSARSISGSCVRPNSIGCGAMYLPTAVLNSAFLRSVIFRKPSPSISPMSPVEIQPSLSVSAVASGFL